MTGWQAVLSHPFWLDCLTCLADGSDALRTVIDGPAVQAAQQELAQVLRSLLCGDLTIQLFEELIDERDEAALLRIARAARLRAAEVDAIPATVQVRSRGFRV